MSVAGDTDTIKEIIRREGWDVPALMESLLQEAVIPAAKQEGDSDYVSHLRNYVTFSGDAITVRIFAATEAANGLAVRSLQTLQAALSEMGIAGTLEKDTVSFSGSALADAIQAELAPGRANGFAKRFGDRASAAQAGPGC